MRKLALVLLAGIFFTAANAQFQFGAKGGLNFSSLNGSSTFVDGASTLINFDLGVYARLPIADRLSLQPELVYSVQGAKYDGYSEHVNYLNIPLLLRYGVGEGFGIFTGPQFGVLTSAHEKFDGNSLNKKTTYNSGDFAWAFGVGYRIPESKLGIDARYNLGISNILDNGYRGSARNSVFQLGVTYILFSSGR